MPRSSSSCAGRRLDKPLLSARVVPEVDEHPRGAENRAWKKIPADVETEATIKLRVDDQLGVATGEGTAR